MESKVPMIGLGSLDKTLWKEKKVESARKQEYTFEHLVMVNKYEKTKTLNY